MENNNMERERTKDDTSGGMSTPVYLDQVGGFVVIASVQSGFVLCFQGFTPSVHHDGTTS
jgi:hypothetical protein